jgi:hypothetical protein
MPSSAGTSTVGSLSPAALACSLSSASPTPPLLWTGCVCCSQPPHSYSQPQVVDVRVDTQANTHAAECSASHKLQLSSTHSPLSRRVGYRLLLSLHTGQVGVGLCVKGVGRVCWALTFNSARPEP